MAVHSLNRRAVFVVQTRQTVGLLCNDSSSRLDRASQVPEQFIGLDDAFSGTPPCTAWNFLVFSMSLWICGVDESRSRVQPRVAQSLRLLSKCGALWLSFSRILSFPALRVASAFCLIPGLPVWICTERVLA